MKPNNPNSLIKDMNGNDVDKYRFETGSLYKYDKGRNAYLCVYTDFQEDTLEKAIKAYEEKPFC